MFRHAIALGFLVAPTIGAPQASDLASRLDALAAEVVSAHLNDRCVWPSRAVQERQAALARAVSEAMPETSPLVLLYAVTADSLDNVKRLVEGGASREDPWGTPLHSAVRFSDSEMLKYLISAGFDLESRGNASGPALLVAASDNRVDNVRWLVENGADVNATDTQGVPVIRFALVCRNQELVDYLLQAGAVPDQTSHAVAQRLGVSLADQ